ncbi:MULTISPECIES: UDP-2,4-diacetamido-2,4,6-trideoxy-beta-L-altropyranose hydrolase [unclassified Caulobacter]|uniref:UDP-2,4-diacetamido-2,4, 6-trideoxy-beta-L-altropyranose hydrolase n=1 Tax=unclassified Caulobacter TaxID=2648921 RepID=UPI000D373184|nr:MULTISPECIES: UDP-2,4-diacetamido-2,4,6-trideoxy-beta-L-altropyranose hydrolase [unclassified Caulobacter]PTS87829.1 UDP-2,4-diacetamido-2,4,6-trideoxy-beta-L-altropyranose hydrolase [Caulobacter sp. HMWF009]PTT04554.1 UDP-2,4-diacetamido-2,4,6-trideoxy-beta-L-altropyranose hydrolase [Caulobacter sp. HMWF025]
MSPQILFVCNAGPEVGGGHVMRSLTLAGALEAAGASCAFLSTPAVDAVLDAFAPDTRRAARPEPFDAVVFDHYGLSAPDHRACARGRPTLVIDDLADRPLAADLVLDAGPARQAEDYAGLVPPHARLMLGPHHAPVRSAFPALREAALARRAAGGAVRRILISLGLTDVGGITGRVVDLLLPLTGDIALDVVLGSPAPSLPRLRALADPRLTLHVDTQDMPRLTLEADLAVGAGGSTSWERCILALPTLTLILADNQIAAATALAEAGASPCLDLADAGFDAAFAAQVERLLADEALRASLSAASATVCDGGGAQRVARAFLGRL